MKGWIEIFRAGNHTSSNGKAKNWTNGDLDKMVTSYNAGTHEAPIVVGHPKSNDPAYGWLKGMKRSGDQLLGKFKQVAPEFAEMVKEGRFKKRSISVYPDGTIRHVGFLGAQPPAVKGLRDIEFNDDENAENYEFEEKEADVKTAEELQKELDAEKKKNKELKAKGKTSDDQAKKTEADFAEHLKKTRRKEIVNFVEAGVKEGKILPAWKDKGLVDFMDGLEDQEETFEFSEGKEETRAEWFKGFMKALTEHPLFKEMAKPGSETNKEDSEFAEDEKEAEEMAAGHRIDGK